MFLVVSLLPAAALAQTPPKPTNFSVSLVETRGILQAEVSIGTSVTRWQYRQRIGSNGTWGSWQDITSNNRKLIANVGSLNRGVTYGFQVRAVNSAGEGPESDTKEVTVPAIAPPKPSSFTATAGDRQVTLAASINTNNGSEITRWQYQQKSGSDGSYGDTWTDIASSNAKTSISTVITGLTNGTAYRFKIRAENGAGRGGEEESEQVTPSTIPATPTGLTASAGNGEATLSWTAGENGGSAITGWKYLKQADGTWETTWTAVPNSGANTTSYTVPSLTNGTTYRFKVRAVNANGDGAESAASAAVAPAATPAAPTGLTASAGDGEATLSWTAGSNGGSAITGWKYLKQTDGTWETNWTAVPNSGANTTSYTVPSLTNGTTYRFKVRAVNANGDGAESAASGAVKPSTTPAAPTGLTASAGNGTATLSWTAGSNGGSAITGWKYLKQTDGTWETNWTAVPNSGANTTSYTVPSLTNGTTYRFKVRAVNAKGDGAESAASGAVKPSTTPAAPTGLTASAGNGTATLSWTAGSNGGSAITGWKYLKQTDGTWETNWTAVPNSGANTTSYTVPSLTNGTTYRFKVRAVNAKGDGAESAASGAVKPSTTPAAPTGLTASAGNGTATLSWTAGSNGGSAITGWKYLKQTDGTWETNWTAVPNSGANTTSYTVPSLTNGTTYRFKVRAVNANGDGAESAASGAVKPLATAPGSTPTAPSFTPTPEPSRPSTPVRPPAPTQPVVTAGNASVSLSWNPGDDGGSAVTGWQYATSQDGYGSWTDLAAGGTGTLTATVTGLANGASYTFKVRGVNEVGAGAPSPASNTVTPAAAPAAPTRPVATAGVGSVSMTWNPGDDGGSAITGWQYAASDDGYGLWKDLVAEGTDTLTAGVTGLVNGAEYRFRVRAVNAVGPGAASQPSNAVMPSAAPVHEAWLGRVNAALAPEAARALASATARAVAGRMDRLGSGGSTQPVRELAGLVERHGEGLADGTISLREALAGTSVSLAAAGKGAGPAVWVSGDWRSLSGGDALKRDGEMAAVHLGADVPLHRGWYVGSAISVSEVTFDWTDRGGEAPAEGDWTARTAGFHPYGVRFLADGSRVWAKAGFSIGEVEIDDGNAGRQTSDSGLTSMAAGGRLRVLQPSAGLPSVDVKAEALAAWIRIEDNGDLLEAADAGIRRLRVAVASGAEMEAGPGATLAPSVELGLRHDGGDGETGLGVELGGGVSFAVPARGLVLDATARTLLTHERDREEWGAGGGLRLDPGVPGHGLSLGLRLATGDAQGGTERLWEAGAAALGDDGGAHPKARMEAEGGYGLPAPAMPGLLLTPYAGLALEGGGSQRYSLGLRLHGSPAAFLSLEGGYGEGADGRTGHDAMLELEMRW